MLSGVVHTKRQAGKVFSAKALWGTFPPISHGQTVAQKLGLRYEEKALDHLCGISNLCIPHLGFTYISEGLNGRKNVYFCWPDAVIFSDNFHIVTVIEIKRYHTIDAYAQLRYTYLPVLTRAFPGKHIHLLEMCCNYDPSVRFPGTTRLVTDAQLLLATVNGESPAMTSVYIWTGK